MNEEDKKDSCEFFEDHSEQQPNVDETEVNENDASTQEESTADTKEESENCCKDTDEECCNDCCPTKPYEPTFFERLKNKYQPGIERALNKAYNRTNEFIVRKVFFKYLDFIMRKDNWYVRRLESEWKLSGRKNSEKLRDTRGIATLYEFLDKFGYVSSGTLNDLYDTVHGNLFSPMKFDENEFPSHGKSPFDKSIQSIRKSGVFKYPDGSYVDIDAIGWRTKARYNIAEEKDGQKAEVKEYEYGSFDHHGVVVLYDELSKEWIPLWSGQKINTSIPYDGKDTQVSVPCIEIYDSNDSHNDFFCYIGKTTDIPEKFHKHYILTDMRDIKKNLYSEEIKWLKENHAEKLLDAPVIPGKLFTEVRFDSECNCIRFICNSSYKTDELQKKLWQINVPYNEINVKYSGDGCDAQVTIPMKYKTLILENNII